MRKILFVSITVFAFLGLWRSQVVPTATAPVLSAQAQTVELPPPFPFLPPLLVKICTAESGFRQYKKDGSVLLGLINPNDVGLCQINQTVWGKKAQELGFDIYTEYGNRKMALWIFNTYGSDPWYLSKGMWANL